MKKDKDISTIKEPIEALATEFMVLRERVEELENILKTMVFEFEKTGISSSDILMNALGKAKKVIKEDIR